MTYNVNAPLGLVPVRYLDGTPWNGQANPYTIASAYATAIGQWDPVTKLADGTIGIGVAGATFFGVLRGIEYIDTNGVPQFAKNFTAALTCKTGTTITAFVVDDKSIVFTVQETDASGNAGTPLALADVGNNINYRVGTPGTAGNSTTSINNASENTTDTLNLTILGLDPRPGNAVGAYANWLVKPNNTFASAGVTGV